MPQIQSYKKQGSKIGSGTYGTVYKALDTLAPPSSPRRQIVALKKIILHNNETDGFPITTMREVAVLREIGGRCRSIVELFDIAVSKQEGVYLVFEYCRHDLSRLLKAHYGSHHKVSHKVGRAV